MHIDLTDQVAVVTGGGAGIGRAIALACAEAGADIVIADIVPERCEESAARIRERGRRALGIPTDVTQTDQVRALLGAASTHFGRIDILVNNAGGASPRPFLEQSEGSWRRHVDLNLDAECGSVAVFLASHMSQYVTGPVIPVDGGTWASSGWLRNKAGHWTLTGDIDA